MTCLKNRSRNEFLIEELFFHCTLMLPVNGEDLLVQSTLALQTPGTNKIHTVL